MDISLRERNRYTGFPAGFFYGPVQVTQCRPADFDGIQKNPDRQYQGVIAELHEQHVRVRIFK